MQDLKIFFGAYKYLTNCFRESLKALDKECLYDIFSMFIEAKKNKRNIIVDGQGRSLQSLLLAEDCLEHNGFPIIFPTSNANLRPWKKGDILFFNTGSGTGSPIKHALAAKDDGLNIIGMTYNPKIKDEFSKGILVLEPSKNKNPLYAPLGTEFELTSAIVGSSIGYSISDTPEKSMEIFNECTKQIVSLFDETYGLHPQNVESIRKFIELITMYLGPTCKNKVYFRGVGRDSITNKVSAIRFGHLHKIDRAGHELKDLQVIYEGHWDLRTQSDLAIITSGSGSTSQSLNYATQAFISGMRVFGITSFENSDLGRFTNRVDGCLVIPGRRIPYSMYNATQNERINYLPEFELNVNLTMDSLLAQIASNNDISENDMKASHRLKTLE
ncbi:MAG: hypothetical protein GY870_02495 [archaeon]|nr:hypothetical protein [archaeon]